MSQHEAIPARLRLSLETLKVLDHRETAQVQGAGYVVSVPRYGWDVCMQN